MSDELTQHGTQAPLAFLLEQEALPQIVSQMPSTAFVSLLQTIGVEDAGELLAYATRDQLVTAFDEDVFGNERPGEREVFDTKRFVTWLEVLLESGEAHAVEQVSQLSEDFVALVLSKLVFVLDREAMLHRMEMAERNTALRVEKALEDTLCVELEDYLIIAREPDGWDAASALLVTLCEEKPNLSERLLARNAAFLHERAEDLEMLTGEASLEEDVEAAREERRAVLGFVEPQAASAFLRLASHELAQPLRRDPVTRGYLGDWRPQTVMPEWKVSGAMQRQEHVGWLAFQHAFEALKHADVFSSRLQELTYLSNVILSGAQRDEERVSRSDAMEAALSTIALGANVVHQAERMSFLHVLNIYALDVLFRMGCSALARQQGLVDSVVLVWSRDDVDNLVQGLFADV